METRKHVHDIKQNSHGMTKLLLAIPMSQRIGLAQVSTETSIAQQELIRMAIGSLLAEHGIDGDTQRQHARPTPVTQLTPSVSIVREPVSTPAIKKALSAALLVRKNTGPESAQPPRPSPDHTWVVRGSGGYWRKTGKKASE